MRRWNGWGDDTVDYPLPDGAKGFLTAAVGAAMSPVDATREEVLRRVPPSRLPAHDLVSVQPELRLAHARGQSLPDWVALRTGEIEAFPDGVARPVDEQQVLSLLAYAAAVGARVIPYGGGTSVVGHINPLLGDAPVLTINLRYLNRLKRLDTTSRLATFGSGISGPELEAQLRAAGYTLGHFPQSFELSTLGGWIVTRSSGQQSLRYGRIEDLFAGGTVLSPAGTLHLPPFPASAAGPDLRQLVLGSEGRLGIVTDAIVRIRPLPELEEFHAVFFPDFESGLVAVRTAVQEELPLSLLRLSTAVETETTLALAGHERLIGLLATLLAVRNVAEDKAMLMCGFTGSQAQVRDTRHRLLEITKAHGGVHVGRRFGDQWASGRFHTPYLRNTLWERGYAVDTLETSTTWAQVPETMAAIEADLRDGLAEWGEKVHVFTHLSHVYPSGASIYATYLFRLGESGAETLRRWEVLKAAASRAIVHCGGTISHQHGVGRDHMPYLAAEKGELGLAAIGDVIGRFDPMGMMNPGKLVP
jgi:alkyldihydroxyacetonephosphate synthase